MFNSCFLFLILLFCLFGFIDGVVSCLEYRRNIFSSSSIHFDQEESDV